MKILIISKSFYPTITPRAFRTTELAKEFSRQGHDVTVITPKDNFSHIKFEEEHNLSIKDLGKPSWKPIELKGKGFELFLRRFFRRILLLFFQYPDIELQWLVKKLLKNEQGYDLMISIAVPYSIHWGVASARSKKKPIAKVWIADCGDPFMGQENDTFKLPFYFKYIEKWFCKKADYLTVPTVNAIEAYYPEFHNKIRVIPQGFRFEDIKIAEEPLFNVIPKFAYAGGFIPGRRDPKEFLEYLNDLNRDYEFHVYTNTPALVTPFIDKAKGKIKIHNFIPRQDLLFNLSKMNFVVNFENIGKKQTPSKLIDYAIINRPILSIKTGNFNKEIVDEFLNGCYMNQVYIEDPDQYRIENVCTNFLKLCVV